MSTKWAENCDPLLPAGEFARAVLAARMQIVENLLPLAAHHYQQDIEYVHQLRVGCRRASAALRAFTPLIRKKPTKLKQWLSRIRDAAGPARDIDVLLSRFAQEPRPDEVTEYATGRLAQQRLVAQRSLVKVARKTARGKLERAVAKTLKRIECDETMPLNEFGRHALGKAYAPFAQWMRAENPSAAELHQLRIAGKRLRYSLEIFHGLFSDELGEKIYPVVEDLQGKLGEINDHATAQALYQSWLADMPADDLAAALAGRIIAEHQAAERLRERFARWWGPRKVGRIALFFKENLTGSVED